MRPHAPRWTRRLYIGGGWAQCRAILVFFSRGPVMNRRNFFQTLSQGAALAGLTLGGRRALGAEAATPSTVPSPKLTPLTITKVKAILTAPARIRLCVVK